MGVHVCPVCGGTGKKPKAFYEPGDAGGTGDWSLVPCRACGGSGVIITPDSIYPPVAPIAPEAPKDWPNTWKTIS